MQAPVREEANLDNHLLGRELEGQTTGTIDSRRQYTESQEPSSALLESQTEEPEEVHRPIKAVNKVEPRSILKNSRHDNFYTYDSRKSPLNNSRDRDRPPRATYR